jgi:phosphoglycolate phosphatase
MMKKIKIEAVVFDLDGTLVSSHETILKTVIMALAECRYRKSIDEEKFYSTIGKHFREIFSDLKIEINDLDEFIRIYKSKYFDYIGHSNLYPGVISLLDFLKTKKIKIGLLTTKMQDQADKIIEHFNLQKYFDIIVGRRDGIEIKPSPQPLNFISQKIDVSIKNIIMVGDTEMDIQCGKNAGAQTCAVTFGYRTKEILMNENPDFVVNELLEIKNILYRD